MGRSVEVRTQSIVRITRSNTQTHTSHHSARAGQQRHMTSAEGGLKEEPAQRGRGKTRRERATPSAVSMKGRTSAHRHAAVWHAQRGHDDARCVQKKKKKKKGSHPEQRRRVADHRRGSAEQARNACTRRHRTHSQRTRKARTDALPPSAQDHARQTQSAA